MGKRDCMRVCVLVCSVYPVCGPAYFAPIPITAWVSDSEDTPIGFSLSHKLTQCQPSLDSGFWQSHPKTSLFPGFASPVTTSRVTALIVPLLCLITCNSFHSQRNRFTGTLKAKCPHRPLLISGDLSRAPPHLDSSCWSKPQGSP